MKSNEVIEIQGLGSQLLAKILTATQDQFTIVQSKLLQKDEILAEKQQQLNDIKNEMKEIVEETLQSQTLITELEKKVKESESKLNNPVNEKSLKEFEELKNLLKYKALEVDAMTDKLGRISGEKADLQTRLKRLEESAQELGTVNMSLSQKLETC